MRFLRKATLSGGNKEPGSGSPPSPGSPPESADWRWPDPKRAELQQEALYVRHMQELDRRAKARP